MSLNIHAGRKEVKYCDLCDQEVTAFFTKTSKNETFTGAKTLLICNKCIGKVSL